MWKFHYTATQLNNLSAYLESDSHLLTDIFMWNDFVENSATAFVIALIFYLVYIIVVN